ncbi:hypothetical protein ACHQM5_025267 [Ranunculus cassubicifolius]
MEVKNGGNEGGGRLPREAKKLLHTLASSWDDVIDSNALEVVPLKGAMTNAVFAVNWSTEKGKLPRKVLVRIYGEGVDVFFDRNTEIATFECMSKHGQGPHLLGRFPNGRVEEFIHARTLSASDLRDPEISYLIATKLKEFHDLDMPGPSNTILWDRMRYLGKTKELDFADLQYGNIMIEEETRLLTIIDYEYAGYNPVAFDLANHFCEMAADYHSETPHIMDYDKYPDSEERERFARVYLSSSGHEPSDTEVEQLVQDAEKYTLASHLLWGLWGIISEKVNEIDFDYMEYARQRFQQYWATKQKLLDDLK